MNNLNEQNENIEDRIKSIISKKLKNNDFKNELDSDKIEIIEKLFEIFPDLKDKKKFFNNINTNIHKKIKKNDSDISYHFFDKDYNININLQEIINL